MSRFSPLLALLALSVTLTQAALPSFLGGVNTAGYDFTVVCLLASG